MSLGRNKYFNAYASMQTKRSKQTSTSSSTYGCSTISTSETNYVETCSGSCPNEINLSSASTSHVHDGVGPCVTTIIDCGQATTTITSTPDGKGTYTLTIVYPGGTSPDPIYGSYFHGYSDPYY